MGSLELVGAKDRELPIPADSLEITRVRIIECKYESLAGLSGMSNIESLEVFGWPDATLDALRPLHQLAQLRIHHLPRVTSIAPIADLLALRRLILETRPSWDSSGKVTEVESLAPLRELSNLEEVNLFGVRPRSQSVDDLLAIPTLAKARVSKFKRNEIARLNAAIPNQFVNWQ